MLKKIFIIALVLQLSLPINIFAGASAQKPAVEMSKEEIALLISKAEQQDKSISPVSVALITAAVVGLGYASYKMGYFLGDIKGFGRGYTVVNDRILQEASAKAASDKAAKAAADEALKQAEEKAFKKGLRLGTKKGSSGAYQFFMAAKPKGDNLIYLAIKENQELFSKKLIFSMEVLARTSKGRGPTSMLILKLMRQTSALKTVYQLPSTSGGAVLEKEILSTMTALNKSAASSSKEAQRVIEQLISEAHSFFKKPSARGGIIGGALIVVLGGVAYLWTENEGNSNLISGKRAFVEADLASVYKETPELLAAKILVYKEMFGLDFVSSVVYENRGLYGQAAVNQFTVISSDEIKDLAGALSNDARASNLSFGLKGMKADGFNPLSGF